MIGLKPSQPFTPCQPITVDLWIAATVLSEDDRPIMQRKNKLTVFECLNHQYVNMALFNVLKKGRPAYFLDQNHHGI